MQTALLDLIAWLAGIKAPDTLEWLAPEWLWLALLWPVLVLVKFWLPGADDLTAMAQQTQLRVRHPLVAKMHREQGTLKSQSKTLPSLRQVVFEALRGLMIIGLAIALAQPVESQPKPPQTKASTVRDIQFVIESSASFVLPDYELKGEAVTRMTAVKDVLDRFIAGLPGNRFGMTVYASQAYSLLPLTHDAMAARVTLKRLQPYLAGRTDEAMAEALGLALQAQLKPLLTQLKPDRTESLAPASPAKQRQKVIVLISDGLSHTGETQNIALTQITQAAQWLQVPIYTIGVGSQSKQADKRDVSGLLYQSLESQSLQLLAEQTQGRYFRVGSREQMVAVLETINQLAGVPYTPPQTPAQQRPLAFIPIALVLVVMALYWLLSVILIGLHVGSKPALSRFSSDTEVTADATTDAKATNRGQNA